MLPRRRRKFYPCTVCYWLFHAALLSFRSLFSSLSCRSSRVSVFVIVDNNSGNLSTLQDFRLADDSPGRSSILLYIPYVTFTMGSKEARNGRPVLQITSFRSSEFRFALEVRSSLLRSNCCRFRTAFRYDTSRNNLASRMHRRYVIHRES